MSVSYANALAKRIDGSFLCCTRMEGLLKNQLSSEVGYLHLEKRSILDLKSFLKLRKFVKENRIDLIQAHSSSWFLTLLVKLSLPGLRLVWHDHYGRDLIKRKPGLLKPASKYFDGIISVNKDLEFWSKLHLSCKRVRYVKNFLPEISTSGEKIELKGGNSFKIICVANLRPQKDHLTLLQAFKILTAKKKHVSLHLIGKDEDDDYSKKIKKYIKSNFPSKNVFLYGEQENVGSLVDQADLGVLSSASEGLPLALLEYGRSGLPVVCTDVGYCAEVLDGAGKLVPPGDSQALAFSLAETLEKHEERNEQAKAFQERVMKEHEEGSVIPEVLSYFNYLVRSN